MKKLNNIPNFKLIKNIFITLLDEDTHASEVQRIAQELDSQILRAAWSVFIANASVSDRAKLGSPHAGERKEAAKRIIKQGVKDPTVVRELQELLNSILTDINAHIESIT